jgi:hypothetical protein
MEKETWFEPKTPATTATTVPLKVLLPDRYSENGGAGRSDSHCPYASASRCGRKNIAAIREQVDRSRGAVRTQHFDEVSAKLSISTFGYEPQTKTGTPARETETMSIVEALSRNCCYSMG